MRRIQLLLCALGLAAAPTLAAADTPRHTKPQVFERHYSFSTAKGRLGAMVIGMTPELRDFFGVARDKGVLVASVEPNSAAAAAGLRAGDVILDVQATAISDATDVVSAISSVKKGESATIAVSRSKVPLILKATMTDDPAPPMPAMRTPRDLMKQFDDMFRDFDDDDTPAPPNVPNTRDKQKT